jgi:FixJ family two-component response regulator
MLNSQFPDFLLVLDLFDVHMEPTNTIRGAVERSTALFSRDAELRPLRARHANLTAREREVFALVVSGLPNKQVGSELGISEITVKAHRGSLMRKMQANSLPELVNMASRLRLARARAQNPNGTR